MRPALHFAESQVRYSPEIVSGPQCPTGFVNLACVHDYSMHSLLDVTILLSSEYKVVDADNTAVLNKKAVSADEAILRKRKKRV